MNKTENFKNENVNNINVIFSTTISLIFGLISLFFFRILKSNGLGYVF